MKAGIFSPAARPLFTSSAEANEQTNDEATTQLVGRSLGGRRARLGRGMPIAQRQAALVRKGGTAAGPKDGPLDGLGTDGGRCGPRCLGRPRRPALTLRRLKPLHIMERM